MSQPQDPWSGIPDPTRPYPPPPGFVPYPPPPPEHPSARTAMILGIVAVAGFFFCVLPVVVAPFAWASGARAVREIDASGGRLGGRGDAQAGMVLGIVGTVLLGLGVLSVVLFFGLFVALVGGLAAATGA